MRRIWIAGGLMLLSVAAHAVPTTVTVRAISRDAKVIGTQVGGARIVIREVESGRVLAEGVQLGGTGDTRAIMVEPHARFGQEYAAGEGTAAFVATVDIDRPTMVEVSAVGPLKFPEAQQRTSKTLLLVPGQHITGEGILLEIHGFVIDVQEVTPEKVRMRMVMT